jgi:hypothetical protein
MESVAGVRSGSSMHAGHRDLLGAVPGLYAPRREELVGMNRTRTSSNHVTLEPLRGSIAETGEFPAATSRRDGTNQSAGAGGGWKGIEEISKLP